MNNANALGFSFFGVVMCVMPILAPGWFPHTAIDGSSARALWVEIMGLVQSAIGFTYLARHGYAACLAGWRNLLDQRGAIATADWQGESLPTDVVVVDFAQPGPLILTLPDSRFPSRDTVKLAGAAAARWLALGRAGAAQARLTNLVGRSGGASHASCARRRMLYGFAPVSIGAFLGGGSAGRGNGGRVFRPVGFELGDR